MYLDGRVPNKYLKKGKSTSGKDKEDASSSLADIETGGEKLDFDLKTIISDDLRNQLALMLERIENINKDNERLREDCNILEYELERQRNMYVGQQKTYLDKSKEFKASSAYLHEIEQKNYTLKRKVEFYTDIDKKIIEDLTDKMESEKMLNHNSYEYKIQWYEQSYHNLQEDNAKKKVAMQQELADLDSCIGETQTRIGFYNSKLTNMQNLVTGQDSNKVTDEIKEYNDLRSHLLNNFSSRNYAVYD